MKTEFSPLAVSLQLAKARNSDAYKIIGAVSGFGEKRVKEIAEGAEPTTVELYTLRALA